MARNTKMFVDVNGKIWKMWVQEEEALRASTDENYQSALIQKSTLVPAEETEQENRDEINSGQAAEKSFLWPDKAVYLLIEIYREKKDEFAKATTRSSELWSEIAHQINSRFQSFNLSGLQCSNKWSGLKRTYKNIYDENKRSGNSRNSWAFFSVMDSLMRAKVYMQPLAKASSDGRGPIPSTASSKDTSLEVVPIMKNPLKRRRMETILENYMKEIRQEREDTKKRRLENKDSKEAAKAARREKRSTERAKRHADRMKIQQALVDILQSLARAKE